MEDHFGGARFGDIQQNCTDNVVIYVITKKTTLVIEFLAYNVNSRIGSE